LAAHLPLERKRITEWNLLGTALGGIDTQHHLSPATRAIIDEVRINLHDRTIDAYYYTKGKKIAEQHHLEER
jgi:hypothetical protein